MKEAGSETALRVVENPLARRRAFGPADQESFDPELAAKAREDLRATLSQASTPLLELDRLAQDLGVARVAAKYEGSRTELASFKSLGGAYAVGVTVARLLEQRGVAERITPADLEKGLHADEAATVTVTCASDGNHGRSVAWGARRYNCRARIYLPEAVSPFREQAILALGAQVCRVAGNYDEAVRRAAEDASQNGWLVVSDTATPDYRDVPSIVTAGYTLMIEEAVGQLGGGQAPTHVLVQVGCGGLAAMVAGYFMARFGANRPRLVAVEPVQAACLMRSIEDGASAVVGGSHDTRMGGLACGELSFSAWPILRDSIDLAIALPDRFALEAVRRLHHGSLGASADCGESGAATVGALLAALEDPELRSALRLDRESRILLFLTEGVTDPEQFQEIVERSSERGLHV
jgi:diaminopropionate ammonia-lyase